MSKDQKQLERLEAKLLTLIDKNNQIVQAQHDTEEEQTDLALQDKYPVRLENRLYKLQDQEAYNLEAQSEIKRLIKNLKAKIKRNTKD